MQSPIEVRKNALIKSFRGLGISAKSMVKFLQNSIEAEEQTLAVAGDLLTSKELSKRTKAVMEAKVLMLVLKNP